MSVLPPPEKHDKEHLRHVEKDVLIPKKLRAVGKQICSEYMEAFSDCVRGRTISMVWKCRQQNNQMQACLKKVYDDPEQYEKCKQEYLQEREEYRHTGIGKKMKRV